MPCAYDRVKMLAGDPTAQGVCFLDSSNGTLFDDSMLPADVDDANALPNGIDPIFVGSIDNFSSDSNVYYYPFHFVPSNPVDLDLQLHQRRLQDPGCNVLECSGHRC